MTPMPVSLWNSSNLDWRHSAIDPYLCGPLHKLNGERPTLRSTLHP